MNKNTDHEVVIKTFFDSVIKWLDGRQTRDATERQEVATTLAYMKEVVKNPKKHTTMSELSAHGNDLMGLTVRDEKGRYCQGIYSSVVSALFDINRYYRKPTDILVQQDLEKSIKDFFIVIAQKPLKKLSYRILPANYVFQKVIQQQNQR